VGLGGFVGANARFVVSRGVGAMFDSAFPLGTFIINTSGSFLLGILGAIVVQASWPSHGCHEVHR
jgi:fluoride exporter